MTSPTQQFSCLPTGVSYSGLQVTCNIVEWGGGPLGPEAMFFKPNSGAEFEVWAVSRRPVEMGWIVCITWICVFMAMFAVGLP